MTTLQANKTKKYFQRFQVKYRRRRENKTDYRARRKMIQLPTNDYNTRKYRFIVRTSNRDITCQLAYATIRGDIVVVSAYAHELPRYGIKVGLKNWASAYCTGLLCAERAKTMIERDDNGEIVAILDIGIGRATTGSRFFAALKGAVDGGLSINHKERRFPGYDAEKKKLDTSILNKYIYGGHVANYMRVLQEENEEKYKKQFGVYLENEITPDSIQSMYEEAHKLIRQDPSPRPTKKMEKSQYNKYLKPGKMTKEEKKRIINEKIKEFKESIN